jgi:hypothetical protein
VLSRRSRSRLHRAIAGVDREAEGPLPEIDREGGVEADIEALL